MLGVLLALSISAPGTLAPRVLAVLGEDFRPVAGATALTKHTFLTNAHVPEDEKTVLLLCDTLLLNAEVKRVSATDDLSLLETSRDCPVAVPTPVLKKNPALGSLLWWVGYPLGSFAIKGGFLSEYHDIRGYRGLVSMMQGIVDGEVLPGNSGGPVIDETGHLAGIVSGRSCVPVDENTTSCRGVFVPAETINKFLREKS